MTMAMHAVLQPLYQPFLDCMAYNRNLVDSDHQAVLFALVGAKDATYRANAGPADPGTQLPSEAASAASACSTAARSVRAVHLSASLARNTALRRVLAQMLAYASDSAQGASFSLRLSFDITSGDTGRVADDFAAITSVERSADAHLAATIPYIGKL